MKIWCAGIPSFKISGRLFVKAALFLSILFPSISNALTDDPKYSQVRDLKSLLPQVENLPAIAIALPDDFVLASKSGECDLAKGVFWGDERTLERYFAGEVPLNSCIIAVKESTSVIQSGANDFKADGAMKREWKRWGGQKLSIKKARWGEFPLLIAEATSHSGMEYYLVWLGLNDPSGKTLMFTFLCPDFKNRPDNLELAIWYYFIKNSYSLNPEGQSLISKES